MRAQALRFLFLAMPAWAGARVLEQERARASYGHDAYVRVRDRVCRHCLLEYSNVVQSIRRDRIKTYIDADKDVTPDVTNAFTLYLFHFSIYHH